MRKNWKKGAAILSAITSVVTLSVLNVSAATVNDTTHYYDMGRGYTSLLGSTDKGGSTAVISASAIYTHNTANQLNTGRERIRMWSKLVRINNMYPPSSGYFNFTQQMNLRMYSDDTRSGDLITGGTDPQTNKETYDTIGNVVWDIFGYAGVPTTVIEALANNMYVSGTEVVSESGRGFDKTVIFYQPDDNVVDLPDTIAYSNADAAVGSSTYSGATAVIDFTLPTVDTNFKVWPQGIVKYGVYAPGAAVPSYVWSGSPSVHHLINRI